MANERGHERRKDGRGPLPPGGDRRRPMSDLSLAEFLRLARLRKGKDPELPPEEELDGPAPEDPGGEGERVRERTVADRPDDNPVEAEWGTSERTDDDAVEGGCGTNERTHRDGGADEGGADAGPDGAPGGPRSEGPDRGVWHWPAGAPRVGDFEAGVAEVVTALQTLEVPADLDDGCLQERTVDVVRLLSLVTSTVTAHVREWDARCLWGSDRSKSPSSRLARDANCSKKSAATWVMLGRALARMPHTAAAWEDGRVSTDHVWRLVKACTDERLEAFLAAEERLIGDAVRMAGDHAGFNRVITAWEHAADDDLHDPTDPDDVPKADKRRRDGRHARMVETTDGFDLEGSFTRIDGAIIRNQWQLIADELWKQDWHEARSRLGEGVVITDADLSRTPAQRRADAFVEMARRAGACRPGDVMPKPLITIHVTSDEMTGPVRQTFNGLVMTRRDVADLLGEEADWERIIYGPSGQPVSVTSKQRNFTGALRRAVQLRDLVCSHPTCDVDAERCQVDHIVEWADGGPTNLENARLLCSKHNYQRPGRGKTPPRGDGDEDGDGEGGDGEGGDGEGESD